MAGVQKPRKGEGQPSIDNSQVDAIIKRNRSMFSRFLDKSKPAVHSHRRKPWGVEGVPSVSRLINDLQVFLPPLPPPSTLLEHIVSNTTG